MHCLPIPALLLTFAAGYIDNGAIEIFVESRGLETNGPGEIIAVIHGDLNADSFGDSLIVYTYARGSNGGDEIRGQYLVAFLTFPGEPHEVTRVLFLPDSVLMMNPRYGTRGGAGGGIEITAGKRLPGDPACCPSGQSIITFTVSDGEIWPRIWQPATPNRKW